MKPKKLFPVIIALFLVLTCSAAFGKKMTIIECLETARRKNLDYKILQKSYEISELQEKQAAAKYIPIIKGSADGKKNYYTDAVPADSNEYEISLEQPIYHFGAIANNLRANRAQKNASHYDLMEGEIQLEKAVLQAYMDVLRAKRLLKIRQHSINTATNQLKTVEEEVKAGKRGPEATLRWKVLINGYEDNILFLTQNLAKSYIVLNTLMERDISSPIDVCEMGREEFEFQKFTLVTFNKEYKYNEIINYFYSYSEVFSPSMRRQNEDVKVAEYQLKKEIGSNYPRIDFVPKYSCDGQDFPEWTYGLRVQFAFLNMSDWKEVDIKQKKLDQIGLSRKLFYRNRRSMLSDRYSKLLSSMQQVEVNTRRAEEAGSYLIKITDKYDSGNANDVDLVDAYKEFYDALAAETNSLYDYYNESREIDSLIGYSLLRQTPRLIEFVDSPEKYKNFSLFRIYEGAEIFRLVYHGDINKVKEMVDKNPDLLNVKNPDGWKLLHFCAYNDDAEIAGYLLKKGADINVKSRTGMTPLYVAATQGKLKIINFLIKHGANVNVTADRPTRTPLMRAAAKGFEDVVKALVEAGADVNAKSEMGWTPLMYAAEEGNVNIVKFLLEKGAKIDAKNNQKRTAEDLARMNGQGEVETILNEAAKP